MIAPAPVPRGRPLPALLVVIALAGACSRGTDAAGPRPTSVTPDRGPLTVPVPVRIDGEFHPSVRTDFSSAGRSEVDARFEVRLGDVALDGVELRPDGSIAAIVPAGLATGPYDLEVIDPQGRAGTLARAYRVLAPQDSIALVAGFRFDFVGAQEAFRPFAVGITAVDADGATVEAFHGAVHLSDATGTAVPASAALFVGGRWTGEVEIRAAHPSDVLTATDDQGIAGSSAAFAVAPAPAALLAFATAPLAASAGRCEGPVTLALHDAFGAPTVATGPVAVSLAATPAEGFALFGDDSCTIAIGAPTVAAGAALATVWYRATRTGSLDLLAESPSLATATQRHTVAPGAPAALAFVSTPQSVNAGACSHAATVEVRDAYGNPSPSAGLTISLQTSPPGALTFFADAGCTTAAWQIAVAPGATRSAFHFRGTLAQTARAIATSGGLAPDAQDEIVTAEGTASNLVVLSPPRTTVAGSCSAEVTLQAQDSFGNAVASAGAIQVTLSAPADSGIAFFSDSACSLPASGLVIGAGQSTAGFHVRGTRAGAFPVTASSTTLTDATQAEAVLAGPPARIAFASAAQAVAAGSCSGEVTALLQDAYGNVAPAAAPVAVSLSADPGTGFAFHADPLCTSPVAGATIAAGTSSTRAYFRGTRAGTIAISATASGIEGATQDARIQPAAADRLAFATAPQAIGAGACSGAAAVETSDPYGNTSPVAAGATIALSASPAGGLSFFADAACATPVSSAPVAAGASRATFFFSGTVPGSFGAVAAAAGLQQASQQETVNPGPPVQLAFATAAQTLDAGTCSSIVTVEVRDAHANATAVASPATVSLTASPGAGVAFHDGPGCAGPAIASAVVPAGASTAAISFRATVTGPVTVTASSPPLTPASQAEVVRAAPPERLVFTSAAQSRQAGACSAAVSVQAQDAYGNPSPVAASTAVALSADPAAGFAFYSDASCTIPLAGGTTVAAGASGATFHFAGTRPGGVAVVGSAAGLAATPAQAETITPAPPDHLALGGGPQTVEAGQCSGPMTVRSEDGYGNASPLAAATGVALAASPAIGFAFHAGAGCGGPAVGSVEIPAGASSATFSFRGTAAGAVTLTASAAGLTPPSEVETVAPAPAAGVAFATPAQSVTSGECSGLVVIEARDAFGNSSPLAAATAVQLAADPPGGLTFHADASCSTAPLGSVAIAAGGADAAFHFSGTTGGSPARATIVLAPSGLAGSSQGETITPAAAPTQLVFATPPLALTAGTCSGAIEIEARDTGGVPRSPYADTVVTLAASPGGGLDFYSDRDCATPLVGAAVTLAATATRVVFHARGTTAGPVTVTAASPPLTPASQAEVVRAAPPERLVFTSAAQSRQAGACSAAVSLQAQDAYGNPSPVAASTAVALSADPATGFAFYSDASCTIPLAGGTTVAAGASGATFHFAGTRPGSVAVVGSAAGLAATPAQAETITPASPDHLALGGGPQTVEAGQCSAPMTVGSEDGYGNASPLAAATGVALAASPATGFELHAGAGCGGPAVGSVEIPAGASSATFSFRGTAAGAVTLTASAAGLTPPSEVETVRPAPPNHLAFATDAQTRAAGTCSAAVTLQARDAYENPAPAAAGASVSLAASPAAGFALYAGAGCAGAEVSAIALPAGATSATFSFRGTAAGAVTVRASAPGLAPDAEQAETIVAGPPDRLAFEGGPQSIQADACSSPAAVRAVDAHGNASAVGSPVTVALSAAPAAGFRFHAGTGCVSPATTAVTIAAGESVASFTFSGTAAGAVIVTATAPGMAPDPTQTHTVLPAPPDRLVFVTSPQTTAAGRCSAAARIESRDAWGNPSPVAASTVAALAAAPPGGFSFHSDPDCATTIDAVTLAPGTRTADLYWRGTVAGDVAVTATVAGWALAASQTASVTPAATDRFAWDPIPSPQAQDVPFAVTLRARDAWGNTTPSFTGTATLSASAGTVSCTSSCSGAAATGGFAAGVWTGSVSVQPSAAAVTLTATSGAVSGTSTAFDVNAASSRSPPVARLSLSPVVIVAGQSVTFDASSSSDYETPSESLAVSWDFEAAAASFTSAAPPGAAPWTPWTTAKTTSHTYASAGTYSPRLAVKDTETGPDGPDEGYATATVIVLPSAASLCTVTTSEDLDDGATSCSSPGPDGKLSLREALRLVKTWPAGTPTIAFSGPMTIAGSGAFPLLVEHAANIVAQPGVILDTLPLVITAPGVLVSRLELARLTEPVTVGATGEATFQDVYVHDGYGMALAGEAQLTRVRMAACAGACVTLSDRNYARLAVSQSEFRSTGGNVGIQLDYCAGPGTGAYQFSPSIGASVFSGFDVAIRSSCGGAAVYSNTFVANGTGVYGSGSYLLNNVFSGQTVVALTSNNCNNAFNAYRMQQIVWQNASDGCLAADVTSPPSPTGTFSADPRYVFPAARDYRIQYGSPARDMGYDYWETTVYQVDLNDAGPGIFFGASADRGGRETY